MKGVSWKIVVPVLLAVWLLPAAMVLPSRAHFLARAEAQRQELVAHQQRREFRVNAVVGVIMGAGMGWMVLVLPLYGAREMLARRRERQADADAGGAGAGRKT